MDLTESIEASNDIWCNEIRTLLSGIDKDKLNTEKGYIAVYDRIYDHIGAKRQKPDTRTDDYWQKSRLQKNGDNLCFAWFPSPDDTDSNRQNFLHMKTQWGDEINTLAVKFKKAPVSAEYGCREKTDEKVFTIGGTLIDPLITDDYRNAANHIEQQLTLLDKRMQFYLELTQAFEKRKPDFLQEDDQDNSTTPLEEKEQTSIVKLIKGIGDQTISTLTSYYGIPTNITEHEKVELLGHLSTAWGNDPSEDEVFEYINKAERQYKEHLSNGETSTNLSPADLSEYPKFNPTKRSPHLKRTHNHKQNTH